MGHSNRCPDARALLAELVEGELSPAEARRVEGHLALCGACRREESEYRAAIGALRGPREPAPHRDLYAGFAAKLSRTERRPSAVRRPLQLRWGAASGLAVFVLGGASAAYMSALHTHPAATGATVAEVRPLPPAPPRVAQADKGERTTPTVNPDSRFEWKNEDPTPAAKGTEPDPFDPGRIADTHVKPAGTGRDAGQSFADASASRRARHPKNVATSQDFLAIKPLHGPSAEEIIVQKRHEITVAQYGAPQPTDEIAPRSKGSADAVRPFVVAADPDAKTTASGESKKPVSVSEVDDSEVMVNGKRTDVQSAVGYDKRGRPVLIKMNIGPKPATDKGDDAKPTER